MTDFKCNSNMFVVCNHHVCECRPGGGIVAETKLQGAAECCLTDQMFQGKAVGILTSHV